MTANNPTDKTLKEINQYIRNKDYINALTLAKQITIDFPNSAHAWMSKSYVYYCLDECDQAIKAIQKGYKIDESTISFRFQTLDMLAAMNRPDLVLESAQWLSRQRQLDARMYDKLAHTLEMHQDFQSALLVYEKIHNNRPDHPKLLLNVARMYHNQGEIKLALSTVNKGLSACPDDASMLYFKSYLSTKTVTDNSIDFIENVINNKKSITVDTIKLHYALAKELEDCQKYKQSFDARKIGAEMFRNGIVYDVNDDIKFMNQIRKEHTKSFIQSDVVIEPGPVFIVGMPRTGSTLLDRIISNHSEVNSAGELVYFNDCILSGLKSALPNPEASRLDMVAATVKLDFEKMRKQYLKATSMYIGDGKLFTDKLPQNSHYVGLILKSMPNAKVLIVKRNPVANCYAVYKQLFNTNAYPYSYDLEELADYYIAHEKLLNHWEAIGGDAVKGVFYEDLVNDTAATAKSVCEFLGLQWEEACLNFHRNKQAVATASSSQVREKIYKKSLDSWKYYEKELAPLISKLEASGCI